LVSSISHTLQQSSSCLLVPPSPTYYTGSIIDFVSIPLSWDLAPHTVFTPPPPSHDHSPIIFLPARRPPRDLHPVRRIHWEVFKSCRFTAAFKLKSTSLLNGTQEALALLAYNTAASISQHLVPHSAILWSSLLIRLLRTRKWNFPALRKSDAFNVISHDLFTGSQLRFLFSKTRKVILERARDRLKDDLSSHSLPSPLPLPFSPSSPLSLKKRWRSPSCVLDPSCSIPTSSPMKIGTILIIGPRFSPPPALSPGKTLTQLLPPSPRSLNPYPPLK
jgi:hypothetical protein